MKKARQRLPRAPLPKQTGGAHRVKPKTIHRKRKHKGYDPTDPQRPDDEPIR